MKLHGFEENEQILLEMGVRAKDRRIELGVTQKELSMKSGVSIRTITNFENGENISLSNLVSILKVIKTIDNIDLLIPETRTNPYDVLELGHRRKRATKVRKAKKSNWKWGDEK